MSKVKTSKLKGKHVRIQMWMGGYKQACAVTTFKSHISNMFIGVTEGFRYKMRLVHAHFPITAKPTNKENNVIVVKNFLGGKKDHVIPLHKGTTVQISKEVKDELIFDGVDNAMVSLPALEYARSATSAERMTVNSSTVSSFP